MLMVLTAVCVEPNNTMDYKRVHAVGKRSQQVTKKAPCYRSFFVFLRLFNIC